MIDIKKIKITTLSENSVADIDYVAEWGFSVHLSIDGGPSLLFDTGYKTACVTNADVACVRLEDIDSIILSHGHMDHTGGLRSVLQQIRNRKPDRAHVDILCHPAAVESQHVKHTDDYFYRGCPFQIEELVRLGARFAVSSKPVWITENIVLSGEVPMKTDFESVAPICFLKRADEYIGSTVADDQALFVLTDRGLLIILGCAHRGMINTIHHAMDITGVDNVYMVIGGSHLLNTSSRQQEATLAAIERLGIRKVGVSHCTGMRPASFLNERLGAKRFFFNNAGTKISFSDQKVTVKSFEIQEL
jgi:7,8-dihydropterin-6-yl-methyl-4-(beta-D-ribofuranosyl)aminobenzene 5'-phosphate synthase